MTDQELSIFHQKTREHLGVTKEQVSQMSIKDMKDFWDNKVNPESDKDIVAWWNIIQDRLAEFVIDNKNLQDIAELINSTTANKSMIRIMDSNDNKEKFILEWFNV